MPLAPLLWLWPTGLAEPPAPDEALQAPITTGAAPTPPEPIASVPGPPTSVEPPSGPCRDAAEVTQALLALHPSPGDCLSPDTRLGPAGLWLTVSAEGVVVGDLDSPDATARACFRQRIAALRLPPAGCSARLSWPVSVDPLPGR